MPPKRRPTQRDTAQAEEQEEAKQLSAKPRPPPDIDTGNLEVDNADDDDDDHVDDEPTLSNMLITCLLFIIHMATNAALLSGWNPTRCLFW